jgi:hypothetical protein
MYPEPVIVEAAGWDLQKPRPARLTGPVKITIAAGRPARRLLGAG